MNPLNVDQMQVLILRLGKIIWKGSYYVYISKDHPLYKTHKVKFDKQKKNIVPNFVGVSLPRCDQGDREYYCATMLT
jgi:hypothetical protein